MVKYLRSTVTGVVLPYNEKLEKRSDIETLTDEEAADYVAGLKPRVEEAPAPTPEPPPEPVAAPVFEQSLEVEVKDVSEGEPSADELLAALEAE